MNNPRATDEQLQAQADSMIEKLKPFITTHFSGVKPHYVERDRVEAIGYVCGECGEEVEGDGDAFWHLASELQPKEVE